MPENGLKKSRNSCCNAHLGLKLVFSGGPSLKRTAFLFLETGFFIYWTNDDRYINAQLRATPR